MPNKRRLTWFARPQPRTLGQMWQQTPQDGQGSDMREARGWATPENPASRQPDWNALPPLPKWPPLAGEDPSALGGDDADAPTAALMPLTKGVSAARGGSPQTGAHDPPPWEGPEPDQPDTPRRSQHTLWERFRSSSRRTQLGVVAACVCVVLLCSGLGTVALGNALRSNPLTGGTSVPADGNRGSAGALPTTTNATPSVASATTTAAPNLTPTVAVPPLTITFTCASGIAGGKGEVCVHTEPNAAVSLEVRYCDGSFANGKGLRGAAHTDGIGNYTWNWNITTSCTGTATATVTVKSAGQTVTQSTTFTITAR